MDREKLNDEQQLEPETKAFSSFVILATNDALIFPRTQNCREKGNSSPWPISFSRFIGSTGSLPHNRKY